MTTDTIESLQQQLDNAGMIIERLQQQLADIETALGLPDGSHTPVEVIEVLCQQLAEAKSERDDYEVKLHDADTDKLLAQEQRDTVTAERDELVARAVDAREALQEFRRRLYAVPSFGNKVNRATREALTIAQNVILNLDAIGGPLDYPSFNGKPYEAALAKAGTADQLGADKTGDV